jgi:O-antigen/teichoic acid export membrane protein
MWVGDVIATRISSLVILMVTASFIGSLGGPPYHLFNAFGLPKINLHIMTLYLIMLSVTIGILLFVMPHDLNIFGYSLIFANIFMVLIYAVMIKKTFKNHAN